MVTQNNTYNIAHKDILKIKKNAPAVLLLHGILGNPLEMIYLGNKLFDAGFSISIPCFPGHGTTFTDILKTDTRDWFQKAREAYIELSKKNETVFIAGHSMGGLFTIELAREFNLKKIILLSVPCSISSPLIYLSPLIGIFKPVIYATSDTKGINDPEARKNHVCYNEGIPVKQVWSLFNFITISMKSLKHITSDVLIVQSTGDEVIPEKSADYIFKHLGTVNKKKIQFCKSNHVMTLDYDKDSVAKECIDFLKNP